jgi:hypothetical protein
VRGQGRGQGREQGRGQGRGQVLAWQAAGQVLVYVHIKGGFRERPLWHFEALEIASTVYLLSPVQCIYCTKSPVLCMYYTKSPVLCIYYNKGIMERTVENFFSSSTISRHNGAYFQRKKTFQNVFLYSLYLGTRSVLLRIPTSKVGIRLVYHNDGILRT